MPGPIVATVRVAPGADGQRLAIEAWLAEPCADDGARVVLIEGALFDRSGPGGVPIVGLPVGCVCCAAQVPLRVSLTRALRHHRPRAVLLLVATTAHLPQLHELLTGGRLGVAFVVAPIT